MCTAISYLVGDHYFGRNLDLEYSYNESVTIMPRNFIFKPYMMDILNNHYAVIGIANVVDDYPLYYDATNEFGLSVAALNFPKNAKYNPEILDKFNITPYEFIPYILCVFKTVKEVKSFLKHSSFLNVNFSKELPITPLHWLISDKTESITVEQTDKGLIVYDNPIGVLTNNPTFDIQLFNLNNYLGLSSENPDNTFSDSVNLLQYSRGMGGLGLPGDLSSQSRFVKAAFTKLNSVCESFEESAVTQFFHILNSVYHQRGTVKTEDNKYQITHYTSCCNTDKGLFYYTTYENSQISCVDLKKENLDATLLISYPLIRKQQFFMHN